MSMMNFTFILQLRACSLSGACGRKNETIRRSVDGLLHSNQRWLGRTNSSPEGTEREDEWSRVYDCGYVGFNVGVDGSVNGAVGATAEIGLFFTGGVRSKDADRFGTRKCQEKPKTL